MEHLLSLNNNHRLKFEGSDITIEETWSGFIVGHAEWQDGEWLLIGYKERCADCMTQVEVTYVAQLCDIIRWINAGLPNNWDAGQE